MPAVYYRHGMHFLYPENWAMEEGKPVIRSASWTDYAVTISSPGGAFWSVVRYEPGTNPQQYVDALLQTMQQEYEDMDIEIHQSSLEGHDVVGYDLNFFFLDLTSTALIHGIQTPQATWIVHCQAEDREFDKVRDVFLAMTTSLLRGKSLAESNEKS